MSKNKNIDHKIPDNFEDAIKELELIVNEIESDEIKLDVALEKYQHGVSLISFCQNKLKEVEQKIKILEPETGILKDFNLTA